MTSYFSQYIPNIGSSQPLINNIDSHNHTNQGHIKYLLFFNPTLSPDKPTATNQELYRQVLTVVPKHEESNLEYIKLIGLIRGIDSFAKTFGQSNEPTIIKSSASSILVIQLEPSYYLACSVTLVEKKSNFINKQLVELITQVHSRFTLFNKSLRQYEDIGTLKESLGEFWNGFVSNYNEQMYKVPKGLEWFNSLNYRGFLGLLPSTTFKKSSITLNPAFEFEIDRSLNKASGLVVCNFDRINTKRYGVIYSKTNKNVSKDSLVDIYNWLEFNQYHDKLGKSDEVSNTNIFMSNLNFECDNASHNSDYSSGLLQVLNPVNITNSLVVSPLNYTMNGMRSIIGNEAPLSNNDQVQQGQHTEEVSWLSLPQFMRNFSMRDAGPTNNIIQEEEEQQQPQDPIEPAGHYIIGLTENGTIIKKSVHLQGREFQLIIYGKGDIYIMLVYEPSTDIGTTEFYDGLKLDLNPIIEDINTEGGSVIQTSLSSLRGLLSNKVAPEVDQDFFYVILDPQEGSFQTSLPYLPTITSDTPRYQIAMCYLHDQLTNLFLIQQSEFFTQANKLNEYFHKFTGNKLNDWMFYYIHKNNKFIIIIKNKNKTSHGESKVEQSLLGKLNGVLDLGFLDSLSDDVKYWLGKEVIES